MEFDQDHEQGSEAVEMELGPSYDSVTLPTTAFNKMASPVDMAAEPTAQRKPRYRECLKNHAVNLGGHAVDGCGEFLPAGPDGTMDALKCAACTCHRNFHRREQNPFHFHAHVHAPPAAMVAYRSPAGYLVSPQHRPPLALPSSSGGGEEDFSGGNGSSGSRKRFRTKFTPEQKQKMVELAEKLDWRIQRQDEELIQAFCNESGIRRHVLKVWMHNNKASLGGKKP